MSKLNPIPILRLPVCLLKCTSSKPESEVTAVSVDGDAKCVVYTQQLQVQEVLSSFLPNKSWTKYKKVCLLRVLHLMDILWKKDCLKSVFTVCYKNYTRRKWICTPPRRIATSISTVYALLRNIYLHVLLDNIIYSTHSSFFLAPFMAFTFQFQKTV